MRASIAFATQSCAKSGPLPAASSISQRDLASVDISNDIETMVPRMSDACKPSSCDLLKTDVYMRYLRHSALLREELDAQPPSGPVIVDEVQRLPALLDEIHWLIENRGTLPRWAALCARRGADRDGCGSSPCGSWPP